MKLMGHQRTRILYFALIFLVSCAEPAPSNHSTDGSNTGTDGIRSVPDVTEDVLELEDLTSIEDGGVNFDISPDLSPVPDSVSTADSAEEIEEDTADNYCCEGLECGLSLLAECAGVDCGTCDNPEAPACIEGVCLESCDPVACESQTNCEESCPWETTCQEITLGLSMCITYQCDTETNECLSEEGAFTGSFCVRETDGIDCLEDGTGLPGVCSETVCVVE